MKLRSWFNSWRVRRLEKKLDLALSKAAGYGWVVLVSLHHSVPLPAGGQKLIDTVDAEIQSLEDRIAALTRAAR